MKKCLNIIFIISLVICSSIVFSQNNAPDLTVNDKIAFTSKDIDGYEQIYLINFDGTGLIQLTNLGKYDRYSAYFWSPDRSKIINTYQSGDGNWRFSVFTINNGKKLNVEGYKPVFSHNGQMIAFTSNQRLNGYCRQICMIHVDQKDFIQLTNIVNFDSGYEKISWSPDDSKISFEFQENIYVINLKNKKIFSTKGRFKEHAWSPDNNKIVLLRVPYYYDQIYIMNSDCTNLAKITDGCSPLWSPDGKRILFFRNSTSNEIYIINANGADLTKIAEGRDPLWSPDGSRLVFMSQKDHNEKLCILNLDKKVGIELNEINSKSLYYNWSPDGSKLLVADLASDIIFIVNSDGTNTINFDGRFPYWLSDGSKIIFYSANEDNIYTINCDGTGQELLCEKSPRWNY